MDLKKEIPVISAATALLLAAILVLLGCDQLRMDAFAADESQRSNHKIKEVMYYSKNPDPAASGEIKEYPALWMLYEDPDGHTNAEILALKEVASEEEAQNKAFGMKGYFIKGKWYKVVGLWTVNPESDIIDKGNGEKAVFTPLYYSSDDKTNPGDKISVAIYDYESKGISDPVEVIIPEEGKTTEVIVKDDPAEQLKTVAVPEGLTLIYNGKEQRGVASGDGYTLTGSVTAVNKGTYDVTATLASGYKWSDGETGAKTIKWTIEAADLEKADVQYPENKDGNSSYKQAELKDITLKDLKEGTDYTQSISSEEKDGKNWWIVSFDAKGTNTNGKKEIRVSAAEESTNPADQLTIKGKTAKVSYSKAKKKSLKYKITKLIKFVNKGSGKLAYKKVKGSKKISVNTKTGKVTIKKGIKKGKYTIKIRITDTANGVKKTVKCTVRVR